MIPLTCCIFHANKDSTAVKKADRSPESPGIGRNNVCLEKRLKILMGSENHKSESMCASETSLSIGQIQENWIFNNGIYLVFFSS